LEVNLHPFLISALDEGECSTSRPGRFSPEASPIIRSTGGQMGPKPGAGVSVPKHNPSAAKPTAK